MNEVAIRVAHTGEDLVEVRELFRAYGHHLRDSPGGAAGICIENFDQEIALLPAGYTLLLLATVDGEAAGCVALKPLRREDARAGEMKRLWVAPQFRGVRLGRALVEAAMAEARRRGLSTLFLDTVPAAMPEANRLYESLGFERCERYNGNPVADVVFFRLSLVDQSLNPSLDPSL